MLFAFVGCAAPPPLTSDPTRPVVDPPAIAGSPPAAPPGPPAVVFAEVQPANASTWQVDGAFPDWIELQAVGPDPIDLGRLIVDDGGAAWFGPAGVVLAPGARYVLLADEGSGRSHAPFGVSNDGDELLRLFVDGVLADTFAVPATGDDLVWARTPDEGPWTLTTWATPGEANPPTASPTLDPSDALFPADGTLVDFAIEVAARDEDELDVRDGPGVPGTLTYEGVTLDVTVSLKGSGSFQHLDEKPAFRIDVNDGGRRLRGLEVVTLDNSAQDATYAREVLGYRLFAAAGVPAPRTAWAHVTYNGEDLGLYVHAEAVDDRFLARVFPGSEVPMLLEGTIPGDLGETWEELEVDEGEADEELLEALVDVLEEPEHPAAMERLDALVDTDAFVRYAAVEAVAMHWDGYQLSKNFYVALVDGRLVWLPHGTDLTWKHAYPIDHGSGTVFTFCLAVPACDAAYREALADVCDVSDGLGLPETYASLATWLAPLIEADPRNDDSPERFTRDDDALRTNLASRTDVVRSEL